MEIQNVLKEMLTSVVRRVNDCFAKSRQVFVGSGEPLETDTPSTLVKFDGKAGTYTGSDKQPFLYVNGEDNALWLYKPGNGVKWHKLSTSTGGSTPTSSRFCFSGNANSTLKSAVNYLNKLTDQLPKTGDTLYFTGKSSSAGVYVVTADRTSEKALTVSDLLKTSTVSESTSETVEKELKLGAGLTKTSDGEISVDFDSLPEKAWKGYLSRNNVFTGNNKFKEQVTVFDGIKFAKGKNTVELTNERVTGLLFPDYSEEVKTVTADKDDTEGTVSVSVESGVKFFEVQGLSGEQTLEVNTTNLPTDRVFRFTVVAVLGSEGWQGKFGTEFFSCVREYEGKYLPSDALIFYEFVFYKGKLVLKNLLQIPA